MDNDFKKSTKTFQVVGFLVLGIYAFFFSSYGWLGFMVLASVLQHTYNVYVLFPFYRREAEDLQARIRQLEYDKQS